MVMMKHKFVTERSVTAKPAESYTISSSLELGLGVTIAGTEDLAGILHSPVVCFPLLPMSTPPLTEWKDSITIMRSKY